MIVNSIIFYLYRCYHGDYGGYKAILKQLFKRVSQDDYTQIYMTLSHAVTVI